MWDTIGELWIQTRNATTFEYTILCVLTLASGLTAFVACRLIALNKCPGVRPIGIGETARRVVGRAIAKVLSDDIQKAKGPLQLCLGHKSGSEAAVHAMWEVFDSSETEAIILVDATNAFNSLNGQIALRNINHLPMVPWRCLIVYQRWDYAVTRRYHSRRSAGHGNVSHSHCSIIHHLKQEATKQVLFANDASAAGKSGGIALQTFAQITDISQMHQKLGS